MAKKKSLNVIMSSILIENDIEDVISAILSGVSWNKLMLSFSNIAHRFSQINKVKKDDWLGIGRVFHRATDEIYLKEAKGSPFKIDYQDWYLCKCKEKFLVDCKINKNIAFSIEQCEFIVTCPHCGKKEDMRKAKVFRNRNPK